MTRLIRYFSAAFLTLLMAISVSFAKETSPLILKEGAPKTYVVKTGDTLWDISALYLNDPWLWPELWKLNSEIENPHLIYPGDQLFLVWHNGKPQLRFKPKVTLSPKVRMVKKRAVPTVEEGLVLPYLQLDRLVTRASLADSHRVLGNNNGHQYLADQEVFITGVHKQIFWGVYRPVEEFSREADVMVALRLIAVGELASTGQSFSKLTLKEQIQEVMQNDIVLPQVAFSDLKLTTAFFPRPAPKYSQATILGSLDGSQYVVKNQVIVLNKGAQDGLVQGSMFELYQAGSQIFGQKGKYSYEGGWFEEGQQMPRIKVGELMVIRPYSAFSLALITASQSAIGKNVIAISPLAPNDLIQAQTARTESKAH